MTMFDPNTANDTANNTASNVTVIAHHDPVNHPAHYASGSIECIDAIKVATEGLPGFEGMCIGNAIKYLWRYRLKGKPVQDLEKAIWYINRAIQELKKKKGD